MNLSIREKVIEPYLFCGSAAFLWKAVQGKDFDEDLMIEALLGEYDVDRDTAANDVRQVIASWKEIGLIG